MSQTNGNMEHSKETPQSQEVEQLTNGNHPEEQQEEEENNGGLFQISVKLPHEPHKIQVMVSSQEQVQDVRQSIVELPGTFQYTCFHLEFNGKRINDFVELSEVEDLKADSEIVLVEDPYTEKEARMHTVRIRDLVGAAGDRVDNLQGLDAGLSLHDSVTAEAAASEEKEHSLSKYDITASPSLKTILPRDEAPLPKTVKSISLSAWNPPPYHLRQKGHLLYLQVATNEGEQFQVTSHVSGFYVNKCSNAKFDPSPRTIPKKVSAHSLLTLISKISPSFNTAFEALQESNNQKDLLTTFPFQNAIPNSPWLVPPPSSNVNVHQADITRSQESYLISGVDNAETLRDWNEEFQTTRELPRETVQDRVFRERLTSKLFADYNEAAARGAVLVARGEVAPLNPTEDRDAQIFVYNNIFYSFGADGVGTFASEGGDEAARVAVGKDVLGIKAVNQLDINGLFTPGTVVVDYLGKRIVGQSIVPGIFKQREPGEHQIDYGGVEGKDVVATHPDFVSVFEKMSKALRIKKHAVWDKDSKRHDLEGSVETKGLLGTDGRKYVLDLYRVTPLDVMWQEEPNSEEYPHRMSVLRLELVEAYWRSKMSQYVKAEVERRRAVKAEAEKEKPAESSESKEQDSEEKTEEKTEESSDQERVDISGFQLALNPDVCSGQVPQTDEEKQQWAEDEKEVRDACDFLRSKVMPELVQDLHDGDVGFPMDGQSLGQLLHKRGINIRYLGKLAQLSKEKGARLDALTTLLIQEMIARAFKHIANRFMRNVPAPFVASCVAHLLNCLLGADVNANPRAEIDASLREFYPEGDFTFETVTPETLRAEIEQQVALRYRFTLESEWFASLRHLQLLRDIAIKLGLQLGAREYAFTKDQLPPKVPVVNGANNAAQDEGKKKKKKGADKSPSRAIVEEKPAVSIVPDDIVNVVPLVKDASPRSSLAEEALEAGRISLMQNQKQLGQELILESLSLHEQIYGILHPEVAKLYHQLSMLYYQTDEKEAAVELARKAVIVTERTLGVDSADTILAYLNLSLFEHASGNTKTALVYIKHAMDLWKIIYGPNHPDSITTMNNAAVMLQHLKQYADSRKWFEASLSVCESLFGKQSINTATILFQLAQALALDQDSKGAVGKMRDAYNIFLSQLGPDDRNTKEAETWLEQLTQNAVSIAKHAKDIQARRLRRINMNPRVTTLGTKVQPQVGQTAPEASGAKNAANASLDSRSIDELLKFIEGGDTSSSRSKQKKRAAASNPKLRGSKKSSA
ncbi:translation initiation factor 3 subunit CLU1 [Aspergillus clavatus NRRL 1]|uniref:Clustered mitochondria protein homolog n=1 Tax=Aspergillus clavatus (strain ATCC 1007 / CBS 513.65 / DSM 816 / NCTC 3887 / NRRL 1 / QM 1276 / 107) TaxID=344612 RepID=CLU_ASPCL|nr:eukaryotic translation initiation factor 3 subunit CLU1/TIF31, putative [Aspergillus clavatus NRRL 1]A1CKI4.1 RecName: Full=Clustered mitochondria protein homolog; AltName: Full=Protein TIF31 homolog [Aspergillus clavatus NRRL 1]EAW09658.1 eukaryotic translation initiation factor 3 subunit CLU1/TIF31, putative [Aspergillus clavatus NRRL 1]